MKVGNIVRCIDNTDSIGECHLTIGRMYKILNIRNGIYGEEYYINNDVNYKCYFEAIFFKSLERKEKLEKLNRL